MAIEHTEEHFSPGERAILRDLRALRRLIKQEDREMDAAGTALQEKIDGLAADVKADNEAVVKGGEAVATAASKFAELKALIEKQATSALSDEEAQQLSTLSDEVDGSLKSGTTELDAHVTQLGEAAASA